MSSRYLVAVASPFLGRAFVCLMQSGHSQLGVFSMLSHLLSPWFGVHDVWYALWHFVHRCGVFSSSCVCSSQYSHVSSGCMVCSVIIAWFWIRYGIPCVVSRSISHFWALVCSHVTRYWCCGGSSWLGDLARRYACTSSMTSSLVLRLLYMSSIFSLRVALDFGVSPLGSFLIWVWALYHLVLVGIGWFVVVGWVGRAGCPSGYFMTLEDASIIFLFFCPTSSRILFSAGMGVCLLACSNMADMGIVGLFMFPLLVMELIHSWWQGCIFLSMRCLASSVSLGFCGLVSVGFWLFRIEVITFSALLCFPLVLAPNLSLRSDVDITYCPSGVSISLMWFIPMLQRSCTQCGVCDSGYLSFVFSYRFVIHGRSGIGYCWSHPLWIVIPDCLAIMACFTRKAYLGNQDLSVWDSAFSWAVSSWWVRVPSLVSSLSALTRLCMACVWYSTARDVAPSPPCWMSSLVNALDVLGSNL